MYVPLPDAAFDGDHGWVQDGSKGIVTCLGFELIPFPILFTQHLRESMSR